MPGLGLQPNYYLTLAAIIVAGFGLGAQLVAAFAEAQKAADNGGRALRPGGLQVWNVVVATEAEEDTEGSLPGDNQSGGGGGGATPAAVMSEHLELKKTVLITVYTK